MSRRAPRTGSSLSALLDRSSLRREAGSRSFRRGEDYFAGGLVASLAERKGTITSKVRGTRPYHVKLRAADGVLQASCTCPMGRDGAFCKHCVATGLAWVEHERQERTPARRSARPAVTMRDVRAWLLGQEKNDLAGMIIDQAVTDDSLRRQLLLKAAKGSAGGVDLATYRRVIDGAVDPPGGFVDYDDAHDYASGIDGAIDGLEELLKEGHASAVVELTEHALEAVEGAIESIDDSAGYMGGILDRLQELHLKACRKARPDPETLAGRLFAWEMSSDWDIFNDAARRYAGVLGRKGLAAYRKHAETEWAKVPSRGQGRDGAGGYAGRFRITGIMESLARRTGDVEAVVAVKKRDLSSAHAFLEIAEAYRKARKHDQALEWAERGLKAFPQRPDSPLHEFLADEYHRRKRHHDAMALMWEAFAASPTLEQYKILKRHAGKAGEWNTWRPKALTLLRESIEGAKPETRQHRWGVSVPSDHTEIVRIFLWEKDVEAAWQEATRGGCSASLWMELAAKREREHPEDALPVYQRQIGPTLNRKNNEAYREAVALLRKIQGLMARLGRTSEFARYLESVRTAHKPKRNFVKLLDRGKW